MLKNFVALDHFSRVLRRSVRLVTVGIFCICFVRVAIAADSGSSTVTKTTTTTTTTTTANWGGLSWGIGLAADFDLGGTRVNSASIINNVVRVTDTSNNVGVGFVLEAHYFFKAREFGGKAACTSTNPFDVLNCTDLATGPFVAIEVGGGTSATPAANGPITGYALGWMVGMRHPSASLSPTSSWNIGIGLRVDPKSQVLGDGIIANQPLPAGDSIRFKTEPRLGLMLLSSFSF